MVDYRGGYGITGWGRFEYGNAKSDIEARYLDSVPFDHQTDVSTEVLVHFTTYCFSSWIDISTIRVDVSEDDGVVFVPCFDGTVFVAPYDGAASKILRPNSQEIKIFVQKTARWTASTRVVFRFTGRDEFGQDATKDIPIVWGN